MVEEEAVTNWSLKDALIAIPFLASALALTWEVGYFIRIRGGAFGLFSIPEHLTFALQALPLALLVTSMSMLALVRDSITTSLGSGSPRLIRVERVLHRYRNITLGISVVGAALFCTWYFLDSLDFGLILLTSATFLPYWIVNFVPRRLLLNPLIIYSGVLVVFFAALAVGFDSARLQIRSPAPLNSIKVGEKGKDVETELNVRVVRTGERGVLYFDPVSQTFGFLPWDYVKRVDWAISPLLPPHR
jgi:hypothetical protein